MFRTIRISNVKTLLSCNMNKNVVNQFIRTKKIVSTKKAAEVEMQVTARAAALAKDTRKRIASYRLRKPDLKERQVEDNQDLYATEETRTIPGLYHKYEPESIGPALKSCLDKEGLATDNYWMYRKETKQLLNAIAEWTNEVTLPNIILPSKEYPINNQNSIFVHGLQGTGKSVALAQASSYFKENGWLVISTSVSDFTRDMHGLVRRGVDERFEIYEQTLKSRDYLQYLALNFEETLKQFQLPPNLKKKMDALFVPSSDPVYVAPIESEIIGSIDEFLPFPRNGILPRPNYNTKPTNLYQIVNLGAWRCDLASPLLDTIITFLTQQTQYPVLFIVDDVNKLDQDSEMWNPQDPTKRLSPRTLSWGHWVQRVIDHPPIRGAVVMASSSKFNALKMSEYKERSATKIRMYCYTNDELQSCLEHYSISKYLLTPLDLELLRRCELLTGGNPKDVYNFCAPH